MSSQVMVSASMGVINPLIGKLTSLIMEQHAKLKVSERKEVMSLKEELSSMDAVLQESAMMEAPDVQVKVWMRQVREVTYDIEDYVDIYVHQLGRKSIFLRIPILPVAGRARISHAPASVPNRRDFVKQIRQHKDRVKDAIERRTRYQLTVDHVVPGSGATSTAADIGEVIVDPKLLGMEETSPVALNGPRDELVKLLNDKNQPYVKVASIVGMAGIGKTTLAVQVHRELQEQFDCHAFVYVGQKPSIKVVLVDIINQMSRRNHDHVTTEHDAMNKLRDLLAKKRYLIIFDDLWSISTWKAINCALPENCLGSRIVATTRIHDVAQSCSNHPSDTVYEMKTLGYSDSKKLFHKRIFDTEDCQKACSDVHDSVLNICGGLPWTIIVVAGYLARTAKPEEWKMLHRSTLSGMEQYPPLQGMRKILHISYASLPLPIKSCLLYLSVFPKNYKINKGRLIWRWIAEGFIPARGDQSLWMTGRSYFNELINRSLIQPVFMDDDEETDPVGCKVHGAIHDFIVSLSSEENFVILDDELKSMPRDVIRRLSVNCTKQEDGAKLAFDSGCINLSQARSITVFGSAQWMPRLANFLLLRVLDLHDADGLENSNLEGIGRLFNLRYLGLGGRHVTELPENVGELQLLETLDLRQSKVSKLPQAAARLQKLARLQAEALDDMPDGMEKMQELEEVSMINLNSSRSLGIVAKLLRMRQLRTLGVKWCIHDKLNTGLQPPGSELVSSFNPNDAAKSNYSKLTSLFIHSGKDCSLDFLSDVWNPPCLLQRLVIKPSSSSRFPTIPKNLAACKGITYLELSIDLSREEDLLIVAGLPDLSILKLSVRGLPIVIGRNGFGSLKVFWFERREQGGPHLEFKAGAMPRLRKLRLYFVVLSQQKEQPQKSSQVSFGLSHLSSLKQIHATIDCNGSTAREVQAVEADIKYEISEHGNNPKLELSRDNEENMAKDALGTEDSNVEEASN